MMMLKMRDWVLQKILLGMEPYGPKFQERLSE
jgi:hypothetical protein